MGLPLSKAEVTETAPARISLWAQLHSAFGQHCLFLACSCSLAMGLLLLLWSCLRNWAAEQSLPLLRLLQENGSMQHIHGDSKLGLPATLAM